LAVCAWEGARLFRVHDVRAARDALAAVGALRAAAELAAGTNPAQRPAADANPAGLTGSGRPRK